MRYTNEWGDKEDFGLDDPKAIVVKKEDLLNMSVVQEGDDTRPLTRKEKRELNDVLNQAVGKPSHREGIINLIVLVSWTIFWILVSHYVFHF
jgi:hypothetical protein